MPRIEKADRRDKKRKKAIDAKYQNVRYRTLRAGDALVTFEVERKTTIEGRPIKKVKRK